MYEQCAILVAIGEFTFVNPGTNRRNTVKAGSEWWVTSTAINNRLHGSVGIAPKGRNAAWAIRFSFLIIDKFFKRKEV